jgi:hypothetical protein
MWIYSTRKYSSGVLAQLDAKVMFVTKELNSGAVIQDILYLSFIEKPIGRMMRDSEIFDTILARHGYGTFAEKERPLCV